MTIDEAIIHAEEVAEENQRVADTRMLDDGWSVDAMYCDDTEAADEHITRCAECAAEHCQLAEWLKELKAHREAWMKVVSEVDQHTEIHSDGELYVKNFDVKKIIAEYRPKAGDNNDRY
jgi:hypothetical protein